MSKRTGRIALVTALFGGMLCVRSAAVSAQTITIGSATGAPGDEVSIDVTLTGGSNVAGTQNTINFDPNNAPIEANASNKPTCTVNAAINKGGTSFAFQPSKCTGTACTGVKALVLALDNTDAIGDATLYTCKVKIAATAAAGDYALTNSGVGFSDPNGGSITGTGVNGKITVSGGTQPTPTPTTPAVSGPVIHIGSASGNPGDEVSFDVTLSSGGDMVAGTQNTVNFDPNNAPIEPNASNKPTCTVNAAINKGGTSFAFQPSKCTGTACTGVKALVLALDNTDPIPDGSTLYTCKVKIAATANPGDYALTNSGVGFSDPNGGSIEGSGTDGKVTVQGEGPTNTPTQTRTQTPVQPTATNTPTATATVQLPTSTPTRTNTVKPTATNTPGGGGSPTPAPFDDDGGCNISTSGSSNSGWLVLIPAIGLLVMRRRSR